MNGIYWVYSIENKSNGKIYIGKATDPEARWRSHISVSKKPSKYQRYIHRAIAKSGVQNFYIWCQPRNYSQNQER